MPLKMKPNQTKPACSENKLISGEKNHKQIPVDIFLFWFKTH